jgi:PEP-CTERM motif
VRRGITLNLKTLLLCALLAAFVPSFASADEIMVTSGGSTFTSPMGTGVTTYSNSNFNGWNIFVIAGSSNSPGLTPYGIDLTTLAACTTGTCLTTPLVILYSDVGFMGPVSAGGFQTTYSATLTGSGTTTEIAWATSNNLLFTKGAANLIGSAVGPFSASGGFGTVTGGPAELTPPYSLTIQETFNANSGISSFSGDANITATPEPSSLVLFGTGLLMVPMGLKRRLRKKVTE